MKRAFTRSALALLAWALAFATAYGQAPPPPPPKDAGAPPASGGSTYKQEELDQMLAPIALYPDSLVAQVLMASTYPLDIVEAARWRKENSSLKGDALQDALTKQPWDASVKSLTEFPDVLERMNKDISWTQKLGDAFLGQQQQVLETVQGLRKRAQAAGNLKSNEYQKVETQTQQNKQVIVIEPAQPDVVYVPTYQPTVVYGAWPYPSYPPYYPPYWAPMGGAFVSGFMWGAGIAAAGALWGNCNWGGGDVNINTNRYNNFNKTNISNGNWQHNADRRGNVPYRDNASRQKYGQQQQRASQGRDQFRGREQGAALNDRSGLQNAANRGVGQGQGGAGQRDVGANRGGQGGAGGGSRDFGGGASGGSRDFGGGSAGSANRGGGGGFNTSGGGAQARASSSRGNSSMGSSRSYGGGGGGAARGGGGGGRGGGGGGRGGGGRR